MSPAVGSVDFPVDARLTLAVLRAGRPDPCHRVTADGALWRTSLMGSGAVTYRVVGRRAEAWGPGAEELIGGLDDLLGGRDRPEEFRAGHPVLEAAARRLAGLRVPRTGRILEALVPSILQQKISGRDAFDAWTWLVRRHGSPAPGPAPTGLMVAPTPERWASVPGWDWRRAGVEPRAAASVRAVAERASSLERLAARHADDPVPVYRALQSIRGVGRWTAAEVGHKALGDADSLPAGDYHLASLTGWALAGKALSEEEAEAFYEQWRPQRYRAWRLLELTPSAWPPRRGPRMARPEHRHGAG